jgi:uncharacterized membrane protein
MNSQTRGTSISMSGVEPILIIFFRWMHIATAAVAVGGVFFLRIVFPIALRALDPQSAHTMLLRTRRVFKMVIHSCILLLLISGTYNAVTNWPKYSAMGHGLGHGLFGVHLLLALIVFGISLWLLMGAEPRSSHLKWLAINLGLMFLTIAAASVLKYARESHVNVVHVDKLIEDNLIRSQQR